MWDYSLNRLTYHTLHPLLPPPNTTHPRFIISPIKDSSRLKEMANSDIPTNIPANIPVNVKGDEPASSESNVDPAKSKSTPPSSGNNSNKRKRESVAANVNINEQTKSATGNETRGETGDVKEVKMNDAGSADHSVKDIEMQDAEAAYDKQEVDERDMNDNNEKSGSNLNLNSNVNEGCKEEPTSEKQRDDEDVLGEVAALLKQVEKSDTKAKLQVEVKVKKTEDGDVKENGEVNKEEVKGK